MKKVSGGMECVFIHDIVLSQLSCDFFFAGFFLPGIGHESQLAEFGVENKVKNLGGVWGVFPVFSFWGTLLHMVLRNASCIVFFRSYCEVEPQTNVCL